MSDCNSVVRSMHDLGLAVWFGGALMGAIGRNAAASAAEGPAERLSLSSDGWAKWAPVSATAIGVHLLGGVGLITGNRRRLEQQGEGQGNTLIKTVVTGVALAATAYSGALGRKVAGLAEEGAKGATEPAPGSSGQLSSTLRQLKVCQWAIPALTAVLVVLGAQQGEQQRATGLLGLS